MTARSLLFVFVLTAFSACPDRASAQRAIAAVPRAVVAPVAAVRQSEAEVREMPLERRPNRLGHFYGNTVRRRQQGTLFVNRRHSDRPLARYLYIAR